jgi:MFS transporter, ACDE family, multidrug resistance protein
VINPAYLKLAGLFFVQTLSRGVLLSVIPLQALSIFGDAQKISVLFFVMSVSGVLAALAMPLVIRQIGPYRSFLFGSVLMFISATLLFFEDPVYFSIGLFFHIFSIAAIEVTLTLYMLAQIPRSQLTHFEPWRIFASVFALTIGPFLGVYMEERWLHAAPFALSCLCVLFALVYFRLLGLQHRRLPVVGQTGINPIQYVRHFLLQPRLRLAYGLSVARSCWWAMFVIYTPIYAVEMGLGKMTGAALVSIGTAWTLSVPFWGWVGRKYGVQLLLKVGFISTSFLTLLVYGASSLPIVASVLLVFSALGATMLDGMGNVLFYRAVRGRDRAEMTAVFATYRDLSQLAAPGLYALLLKFFALPVVFVSASTWMLIASWYCRYIPRQMR